MKWIKRFSIFLLVLVVAAAAFLGTSYYLSKRKPSWYKPLLMDSREMDAAANRAINKVFALHNMAADAARTESSREWRQSNGATTLPAVKPLTITFTQDELTAFIVRWSNLHSESVDKYITGPQFVLDNGEIKFACRIAELDQIGVLRLAPSIDDEGKLDLDIVAISAGSLPIPEALIQKHLAKAEAALRSWLPSWQQSARMTPDGANSDAVKAAMTKLLLHTPAPHPAPQTRVVGPVHADRRPQDDPREAHRRLGGQGLDHPHRPAPHPRRARHRPARDPRALRHCDGGDGELSP
jgi:uncharacterized protein YpmS